jgi:small subunit ribosomal protein S6
VCEKAQGRKRAEVGKEILAFQKKCYIIIGRVFAREEEIHQSLRREGRRHLVHREVKGMTNYEVLFILDSTLEDDKKDAAVAMVQEIIAADGEVGKVDVWGMRKLAYPIQKKNEGFYVVVEFTGSAQLPKELDRRLKISDAVIRHLIINKDER